MPVAFNSAVATNIEILRSTNDMFQVTQKRVATGKKIFGAADDAARYRMSETMLGRARQIDDVNNNIGLGLKTLESTDRSLKSMINLVEQAQELARKAQSEGADNIRGMTFTTNIASTTNITGLAAGNTFSITSDTGQNFTWTAATATQTWGTLADQLNAANIGIRAEFVPSATAGQTNLRIYSTNGRDFTFDGSTSQTIMDDLAAAAIVSPNGQVSMTSAAQANNLFANSGAAATATETGFTVGFGGSIMGTKNVTAATAVAAGSTLVFTDGNGATRTITYAAASTVDQVRIDINNLNAGVRAEFVNNGTGGNTVLRLRNTNGGNISIAAGLGDFASTGAIGMVPASGTINGLQTNLSSNTSLRLTYGQQYDNIVSNINQMVSNNPVTTGRNLINGQNMQVQMDEFTGNALNITGVNLSGTGSTNNALGLTAAVGGNTWTTDGAIQATSNALSGALGNLRNYQAQFSTFTSYMKGRYDLNSSMSKDLAAAGNEIVAADVAEESANLTALQTQQQFAIQAFSIGSQAQQSLLRLLG
jgi:flagellin